MQKYAVVKTGGKQYLVNEETELIIDRIGLKEGEEYMLDMLATFDETGEYLSLGSPLLAQKVKAKVVEHLKGDKIRVAHFKAKVRYRKVKGFRPMLSRIKIIKI